MSLEQSITKEADLDPSCQFGAIQEWRQILQRIIPRRIGWYSTVSYLKSVPPGPSQPTCMCCYDKLERKITSLLVCFLRGSQAGLRTTSLEKYVTIPLLAQLHTLLVLSISPPLARYLAAKIHVARIAGARWGFLYHTVGSAVWPEWLNW